MARAMPHVDGVDHEYITAGGLRQHVALAGPADAPPLVLLHGWPQHWYLWRRVIPLVANRFRVIAPDLRGFGWTDAPPGGYRKERLAVDVLALLDALGVGTFNLAAHDWGGWVGYLLALHHPERVRRYLVCNMVTPFMPSAPDASTLKQLPRLVYQPLLAGPLGPPLLRRGGIDLVWRTALEDPAAMDADERAAFTDAMREPARARASQLIYREFLLRELVPALRGRYRKLRLHTPTHVLFGDQDAALDVRQLDGVEQWADAFEVELVPGAGHFIIDERPDLVAARIGSFLG